jgi:hypothetical protein
MEPVTGKLGLDIFLWVCLAVAAGFFGYLGRRLMERLLKRRADKNPEPAAPVNPEISPEAERLKIEKKRVKAGAKRAKKAGD